MIRLTLAQMRRSISRLTAAGIAIAIGTAFVAATLIAGNVMTRSSYDAITAQWRGADFVVSTHVMTAADIAALRAVPGVRAVDTQRMISMELAHGNERTNQATVPAPSDPQLEVQKVVAGRAPTADDEVALPAEVAERLSARLGDTLILTRYVWDERIGDHHEKQEPLRLVGTLQDPYGAYSSSGGAALITRTALEKWDDARVPAAERDRQVGLKAAVLLDAGVDRATVRAALLAAAPDGSSVRTPDEIAQRQTNEMTGGAAIFTWFILSFAAISLLVAALVIANTFQVLVAQRTRMLALLRAVGANKAQIGRSIVVEATVLGLISSAVGIAAGIGLAQAALSIASGKELDTPLPPVVPLTPGTIWIPLLVGTVVTVLASLTPARAATRVSPLEAMRPANAPTVGRGSRIRAAIAAILVVGGVGALVLGLTASDFPVLGLGLGVLGGAMSFVGVVVGAVFWLPQVVGFVGGRLARIGPGTRLAVANTLRNPRRTTATSTALLIGVTLVTMMSTGAVSARSSFGTELDNRYPVDASVTVWDADGGAGTIPDEVVRRVEHTSGVASAYPLRTFSTSVNQHSHEVVGLDARAARSTMRGDGVAKLLSPGVVVLSRPTADELDADDGDTLAVSGPSGSRNLTVAITDQPIQGLYVAPNDLLALAPQAPVTALWLNVDDASSAGATVTAIRENLADLDVPVTVHSAVLERSQFESVINTLLAVVMGLLAVSVVIALIGVANTLSLSVIERRRESATLRAIGLSRSQLRATLAVEGTLIAGVGAVIGILLGLLYGWAAAKVVLGPMGAVILTVPWRDITLVALIAVVAGLAASVIPGRTAARTSPVAALAIE